MEKLIWDLIGYRIAETIKVKTEDNTEPIKLFVSSRFFSIKKDGKKYSRELPKELSKRVKSDKKTNLDNQSLVSLNLEDNLFLMKAWTGTYENSTNHTYYTIKLENDQIYFSQGIFISYSIDPPKVEELNKNHLLLDFRNSYNHQRKYDAFEDAIKNTEDKNIFTE